MPKDAGKSVIKGTMILIAGNIIVKIIGALFKLPLANIIGADGMGLYNASFTVYDIFLVLSTSGFTLAISKMVSKCCALGSDGEAQRILIVTRRLFFAIGLFFAITMASGAGIFAKLLGNNRSYNCIVMLAPAVLFVSLMCSYRGFYQGSNDMIPTTISQVIEAVTRLVIGLSVSWYLKVRGYSIEIVSAGALAGITVGEFSSTFSLAMMHKHRSRGIKPRRKCRVNTAKILKTLFTTAIPIGISGIIISAINMLDNSIVMHRLQDTGCTEQQANILYGAFNMAFTVFSLPVTIVFAITTSVFPVITFAFACKNSGRVARMTEASMRLIILISTAAAAGFASLSRPFIMLLYFGQPHDAAIAAPLLMLMAPSAIAISLSVLTSTILQATDHLLLPSRSMIIGGAVCLASNWLLVGNQQIGIYGVPVGIFICYTITTILNLVAISKNGIKLNYKALLLKPLLPAAAMAVSGAAAYYTLSGTLGLLKSAFIALFLSAFVYVFVLFGSGAVEKCDLLLLPGGKKIVYLLEKYHLLRKSDNKKSKQKKYGLAIHK